MPRSPRVQGLWRQEISRDSQDELIHNTLCSLFSILMTSCRYEDITLKKKSIQQQQQIQSCWCRHIRPIHLHLLSRRYKKSFSAHFSRLEPEPPYHLLAPHPTTTTTTTYAPLSPVRLRCWNKQIILVTVTLTVLLSSFFMEGGENGQAAWPDVLTMRLNFNLWLLNGVEELWKDWMFFVVLVTGVASIWVRETSSFCSFLASVLIFTLRPFVIFFARWKPNVRRHLSRHTAQCESYLYVLTEIERD